MQRRETPDVSSKPKNSMRGFDHLDSSEVENTGTFSILFDQAIYNPFHVNFRSKGITLSLIAQKDSNRTSG